MSALFPQQLLDLHGELIVDLFAGGGGASTGIEMALGRSPDVAVNHDPDAIAMHAINHPQAKHLTCDVFEVDPREVTGGRPVGLLWMSPDCTDHSSAKGGKPIRTRKRRSLAWVGKRWAGQVRPRVICLENVPEFMGWGPLVGKPGDYRRCPKRAGRTFRRFTRDLEALGYKVEWRTLHADHYGAGTIRKRLFLIARCDGQPIVWPEPTHGPRLHRKPVSAASSIDWSIPMLSIFATPEEAREWARANGVGVPRRPLAEATMRRIARGVHRFVLADPKPFIVGVGGRMGQTMERGVDMPLQTITTKADSCIVVPTLVQTGYGERAGQAPRSMDIRDPLGTIVAGGVKHALVSAWLMKYFGGVVGVDLSEPMPTITTRDHNALVTASIEPAESAAVESALRCAGFITKYYGQGIGSSLNDPLPTVTTVDRMGLVLVSYRGDRYALVDIAMRMLTAPELFRAQGFPAEYVIDRGADGRKLSARTQVHLVGNSVPPPPACAIVRANVPEMIVREYEQRRSA